MEFGGIWDGGLFRFLRRPWTVHQDSRCYLCWKTVISIRPGEKRPRTLSRIEKCRQRGKPVVGHWGEKMTQLVNHTRDPIARSLFRFWIPATTIHQQLICRSFDCVIFLFSLDCKAFRQAWLLNPRDVIVRIQVMLDEAQHHQPSQSPPAVESLDLSVIRKHTLDFITVQRYWHVDFSCNYFM